MSSRGGRGANHGGRGGRPGRQTARPRGLFADGIWHCDCSPRLPAEHFRVKKEGKNQGRWFYTCQQSNNGCGFFLWDDDAKPREEAAVISGKRSEPRSEAVQDGWNAGRSRADIPQGKGLFAKVDESMHRDGDSSTESPTPSPTDRHARSNSNGTKRSALHAQLDDDEFGLNDLKDDEVAKVTDSLETPHKAVKTGVYATPVTGIRRKLPWLEQPSTPKTNVDTNTNYFETPSKGSQERSQTLEPETPAAPPNAPTAKSPSPPTRYKDALANPADSTNASSLTNEVLAALAQVSIPPETLSNVRTILTRHDLKNQGVIKGRDISRLAIKAKDAKIAELQARIASLEADRELKRGKERFKKRQNDSARR